MKIFDGSSEAKKLDEKISEFVKSSPRSVEKVLAIIQIGENASSEKYVNLKKKIGGRLGLNVVLHKFSEDLDDPELMEKCVAVFEDGGVGGVIVQLPLPRESLNMVLGQIPVEKDIDGLRGLVDGENSAASLGLHSPVVRSAEHFIYSIDVLPAEKSAIIIGGGKLVGKPLAEYLKNQGWKVEIDENYYRGKTLKSNLVVLSAGIANLVAGDDVSEGANVIDFGSSVVEGKTVGDLEMNTKTDHLNLLSPSPGGMGPLVVRYLFMNFLGI